MVLSAKHCSCSKLDTALAQQQLNAHSFRRLGANSLERWHWYPQPKLFNRTTSQQRNLVAQV